MAFRSTSTLVLLAFLIARTSAVRNCWYPDGITETPDIPCDPNAEESACCGPQAFCLGSGLCMASGVISRGSCTDRNWDSPTCASQCTDVNPTGGATLLNCNATLNTWICAGYGDCDNDSDVFPVDGHQMNQIVIRPQGSESSPLTIEPNSSVNNATDGGNGTIMTTVTVSPSSGSSANFTSGQMAGVGAGVGVPLLFGLLGAVFIIFRQRKRLQAAEAYGKEHELKPTYHGQQNGYGQTAPYENFAPDGKVHSVAPYYRPISPAPAVGHFREVEPVSEMDADRGRQELEVPK